MKRTMRMYEGQYGHENVMLAYDDGTFWCDGHEHYFPTSLPFEVDVQPLPVDEITGKRIDSLEAAKDKAHAEWLKIAAVFDDKIAKLRALPHLSGD